MRYKVLSVLFIGVALVFGSGITYSIFSSRATVTTTDQHIAKFVFDTKQLDHLEIPLVGMFPSDHDEYKFSISNNASENLSDVTLKYQISIKTYHFVPLDINLYKIVNEQEVLITNCNENYSRNSDNELVCNSAEQEMSYSNGVTDNYIIKVDFPSEYDDEKYSDLVDYLDLDIRSWQKTS